MIFIIHSEVSVCVISCVCVAAKYFDNFPNIVIKASYSKLERYSGHFLVSPYYPKKCVCHDPNTLVNPFAFSEIYYNILKP